MNEPVLCYIDSPWAYFTTQALEDQWGDDWDDAPYEHNAETPYGPKPEDDPYEIITVAYDADLETPAEASRSMNSQWSVLQINAGQVAWLASDRFTKPPIAIQAGTSLADFKAKIRATGGRVYELSE